MFVRARVEEGVTENAVLAPQAGVTHDPKGHATALVVGADNKVALRTLQLGGTHGDQWIVEGGLEDGDRLIVGGLQKIQPGAVVVASEAPVPAATPGAAAAPPPPAAAANAGAPRTPRVVADARPVAQPPSPAQPK
jgi:membrane fusion protein (multidrug efflux system)